MTTTADTPQRPPERRLSIDNGKYTFVINRPGDYRVHVLRHGDPWVIVEQGTNAVFSLVHEMIDTGALAEAVRRWATPGDGYQQHGELHQAFRAYCAERGEPRPAMLEAAAADFAARSIARGSVRWRTDEPPRGVRCLVTARGLAGDVGVLLASVSPDHEGTVWFCNSTRLVEVLAWMPIPEPAQNGAS